MQDNWNGSINTKTDFFNDSRAKLTGLIIIQTALIIIIILFIIMQLLTFPAPIYFKTTADEQIIQPIPLDQPAISSAAVLNFVNETVKLGYTFNYHNVQRQIDMLKPYLDERGLKAYIQTLQSDENMNAVAIEKLVVSAKVQKAPQIIREGIFENRYTWQIRIPLLINYENKNSIRKQVIDVEVIVWRVPETVSANRIKITTFKVDIKKRYGLERKIQNTKMF